MARDLARELYRAFRSQPKRSKPGEVVEVRENIKDPKSLSDVMSELISNRDWRQGLAEGNIFSDWEKIVGSEIASHTTPISLVDGRLTIQTSSTAWATQLTLISSELLKTISNSAPGGLGRGVEFNWATCAKLEKRFTYDQGRKRAARHLRLILVHKLEPKAPQIHPTRLFWVVLV